MRGGTSRRERSFAAAAHRKQRPFRGDERRKAVGLPSMVAPSGLTDTRADDGSERQLRAEKHDMKGKVYGT